MVNVLQFVKDLVYCTNSNVKLLNIAVVTVIKLCVNKVYRKNKLFRNHSIDIYLLDMN